MTKPRLNSGLLGQIPRAKLNFGVSLVCANDTSKTDSLMAGIYRKMNAKDHLHTGCNLTGKETPSLSKSARVYGIELGWQRPPGATREAKFLDIKEGTEKYTFS